MKKSINASILSRVQQIEAEFEEIDRQLKSISTSGRRDNLMTKDEKENMAENLKIGLRKKLLTARQKLEVELKE